MARSEFRFNKKRKHYAYLFKDIGLKRMNLLISTKPTMVDKHHKQKRSIVNVPLYHHPNPNKEGVFYLIPIAYLDDIKMFDEKIYVLWHFSKHDKRKVKRIKKLKRKNR